MRFYPRRAVEKTIFFDLGDTLLDGNIVGRTCYMNMIQEILRIYGRSEDPSQYIPAAKRFQEKATSSSSTAILL